MGRKGSLSEAQWVPIWAVPALAVIGIIVWGIFVRGQEAADNDRLTARIALSSAQLDQPIDRDRFENMPGMTAALIERAEQVKESVKGQLRDPTDPLWGDIWTPDYVVICGTVNGRNAYGAYAGEEMFYSLDGVSGRLPGSPLYMADDAQRCFGSERRVIVTRASQEKPR